jgi:hypothetical protein
VSSVIEAPRGAQAGTEKIPQWMKIPSWGRRNQSGHDLLANALKSGIATRPSLATASARKPPRMGSLPS